MTAIIATDIIALRLERLIQLHILGADSRDRVIQDPQAVMEGMVRFTSILSKERE